MSSEGHPGVCLYKEDGVVAACMLSTGRPST